MAIVAQENKEFYTIVSWLKKKKASCCCYYKKEKIKKREHKPFIFVIWNDCADNSN